MTPLRHLASHVWWTRTRTTWGLGCLAEPTIVPTVGPGLLRYWLPACTQVARASRNPLISTSREWSSNTGARAK